MHSWQLHEAQARLSELIERAESEGPQDIILHGCSVAVVLSRSAFDALRGSEQSLVEFMQRSPLSGLKDTEIERDKSHSRKVKL